MTSVLRRGLSYEGYTVATATDGSAGLAAARETPPDLVVLDVMMPVVDGLEVLRRLRAADTSLPVLMLTGRDAPADQVQGLETGAGDYMVKPFSFEVLLAHIHALLRRREAEQPHSHLRAARPGPNRPPPRAHHPLARRRQRLCHPEDDTVSAIDTATFETIATIPVGNYPHGLRPSPDGRWVYVANMQDTTVGVIDTATNQRVADIEVGQSPVQVAFSPDGATAYVSLNAENAVGRSDVASRALTGKVQVGVGPVQVFVSPDSQTLLVANQGTPEQPSTTVSFVETSSISVVKTVETGQGAHGVVIDPTGQHAYVTNIYGDDLVVLDLAERRVVATLPMGAAPNGVSFTPAAPAPAPAAEIAVALSGTADSDAHTDEDAHAEGT